MSISEKDCESYKKLIDHLDRLAKKRGLHHSLSVRYSLEDLKTTLEIFNTSDIVVYVGNPDGTNMDYIHEDFIFEDNTYTVVCGICVFSVDFNPESPELILSFEGVNPSVYEEDCKSGRRIIHYKGLDNEREVGDANVFEIIEKVIDLAGLERILAIQKLTKGR